MQRNRCHLAARLAVCRSDVAAGFGINGGVVVGLGNGPLEWVCSGFAD
jgi:hypothetical protein